MFFLLLLCFCYFVISCYFIPSKVLVIINILVVHVVVFFGFTFLHDSNNVKLCKSMYSRTSMALIPLEP